MGEQFPTNHDEAVDVATLEAVEDDVLQKMHETWRAGRFNQTTGTYEPRIKITTDQEWIQAHGTDQVDIANTDFSDLPKDRKAENEAAFEVVEDVLEEQGMVDLRDPAERSAAGNVIHDAWLARNQWAKGGELDVPFDQLPLDEQAKDLNQVAIAEQVLQEHVQEAA